MEPRPKDPSILAGCCSGIVQWEVICNTEVKDVA